MKTGLLLGVFFTAIAVNAYAKDPSTGLKTDMQKFSYTVGYQLGQNLKRQKLAVDPKIAAEGMRNALSDTPSKLSPEEMQAAVQAYQKRAQEKLAAQAKKNLETGQAYLEANKKKAGVVVLPSGLQYKVISTGSGKQPKPADTVIAHYRGTLINGTEFDSSFKRNEPATFPVNGVIKGWQEALPMMKEGSKWQVYIPAELAYGANGAGNAIGPNEVLIFDIELLTVKTEAEGKESK